MIQDKHKSMQFFCFHLHFNFVCLKDFIIFETF